MWKGVGIGTVLFALGIASVFYVCNGYAIWHEYEWHLLLLFIVLFFLLFMDVKLALLFLTRKDKRKVRRYVLRPGEIKDYVDIE